MDRAEDFIEQFQENTEDASHLLSVKEMYRKVRYGMYAGIVLVYLTGGILSATDIDTSNNLAAFSVGLLMLALLAVFIGMGILWSDARGFDISNEELALHEFAQAVEEYNSDPPNYENWKNHLVNVKTLIENHDADIFSEFRTKKVIQYIERVEETDADNPSKAHFERFYEDILTDLLEERTGEINDILNKLDSKKTGENVGFWGLQVFGDSVGNLLSRWRIRSLAPIIASLALGFGVYFWYDEQMGSFLTVALLTAVGVLRSQKD